jgi:N-acetylmuramoyl-L-alanine amidase
MTKSAEAEFVSNRDRAERANRAGAVLLVRLHTDASRGRGFAVYYPDRQGTWNGMTGPSALVIDKSRQAAEAVHGGMATVLQGALADNGVRGDSRTFVGSRQGALTGSIFSRVPVVLIEMVVLTDSADASFIQTDAGQQRMAQAIADGVHRFVATSTTEDNTP